MFFRKEKKMNKDEKVELTVANCYQVSWLTPSKTDSINRADAIIKNKVFKDREDADYFVKSMEESIKNIESEWHLGWKIIDI